MFVHFSRHECPVDTVIMTIIIIIIVMSCVDRVMASASRHTEMNDVSVSTNYSRQIR